MENAVSSGEWPSLVCLAGERNDGSAHERSRACRNAECSCLDATAWHYMAPNGRSGPIKMRIINKIPE